MLSLGDLLLFVGIGVIVSLDVAGLTAVKSDTYLRDKAYVWRWAIRNGFWHGILLLGYGMFAVGMFDVTLPFSLNFIADYLRQIAAPQAAIDWATEIRGHFAVVFGLVTIAIVWRAYLRKIVENPLVEEDEHPDWQRRAIKGLLRWLGGTASSIGSQMQSVAVAMDMLALAFLLKALQVFRHDWTRVAQVSVVIFVTVTLVTVTTAWSFRKGFAAALRGGVMSPLGKESMRVTLIVLRLTEPLLIFYFLCELMSFMIWGRLSSSSMFFIGSALLVFALIKSVSLEKVIVSTNEMVDSLLDTAGEKHAV